MRARLRSEPLIRFLRVRERGAGWPWTIPALASLDELPLAPGVTFLVGDAPQCRVQVAAEHVAQHRAQAGAELADERFELRRRADEARHRRA